MTFTIRRPRRSRGYFVWKDGRYESWMSARDFLIYLRHSLAYQLRRR